MADKQDIQVEDYYDKVHRVTWARRTAGFMAGATLGAMYGAITGIVAAFLPFMLTGAALPGIGAVALSAALFAGTAGLMGVAAVGLVGADAAAVATGLEEKEKREKREKSKTVSVNDQYDLIEPKAVNDHLAKQLYSWHVAVVTVPLFAAFGALLAFNPVGIGALGKLGLETLTKDPVIAAKGLAAILGMFGAVIGAKNSVLTNQVSNFYFKVITDKLFTAPEKSPAVTPDISGPALEILTEKSNGKLFAVEKKPFSLQTLLEKGEGRGEGRVL